VFHGVTTEADFNTYARTFDSSMATFARLTDASKINVKPKKIQVVKVQRTGTLSDAFSYYRVSQDKQSELALLNDLELTDQVPAGKLIKIIGE
jgi:predicted Zn-dependent protease